MHERYRRALTSVLQVLEDQVAGLIEEKREDAGAAALRAVVDPENQDAAADRETALKVNAEADGCAEVLELIRASFAIHDEPRAFAAMQPLSNRRPG
jgi:hypothetical protein